MNPLRSDPLFGGLTRPATLFGLPVDALIFIVGSSAVSFLVANLVQLDITWKIAALGMGIVLYGLARLVCARDPRAFRYLALQLATKATHRDRAYWRSGSYSALPSRSRR